jgi:hypothetical protein
MGERTTYRAGRQFGTVGLFVALALAGGCGAKNGAQAPDAHDLHAADQAVEDGAGDGSGDGGHDGTVADAVSDQTLVSDPLPALKAVQDPALYFATSLVCKSCHTNEGQPVAAKAMRDEKGRAISAYDLWQATTMANSARDPYWRAAMSLEVLSTPSLQAAIEAKCLRCHSPMAAAQAELNGESAPSADLLIQDSDRGQLALDGVSCTACHQIGSDGLGSESSYTGGYLVGQKKLIYGPHAPSFGSPMLETGFEPTQATHITSSALCATCHTLATEAVDEQGKKLGAVFHEQTPYLEWRNSDFNDENPSAKNPRSCQGCHVPTTSEDGVVLSSAIAAKPSGDDYPAALVPSRTPYGRHVFVGGNTLIPAILRDNAALLQPTASKAAFDALIAATTDQLEKWTATVAIEGATFALGQLAFTAKIQNLTGHKLPTGYPSRRLWLAISIRDAQGSEVFRSGQVDSQGRITGSGGKILSTELAGGGVMTHRTAVLAPDDVVIYEMVMADSSDQPTFILLRAAKAAKDNRLLPMGWKATYADLSKVQPIGVENDPDFVGGQDGVLVELKGISGAPPYQIEVKLYYQAISARWAAELFSHTTPWINTFKAMYQAVDKTPVTVASANASVAP